MISLLVALLVAQTSLETTGPIGATKAPVLYAPFDVIGTFASGFALPTGQVVTVVRAGTATATYIDANGLVANAAANTARVEKAGLLVEQARTNSALQSETTCVANAVQAPWTLVGAPTCVTNAAVAPDAAGSTTADRWTSAVNTNLITQTATTASTSVFAVSQWFNRAVTGIVTLQGTCGAATATACTCWTSDGRACTAAAATTTCTVKMTANTTWSRLIGNYTCNAATTAPVIAFAPGELAVSTGTADVWGAQLEGGNSSKPSVFATSYMATVAASVTRNGDTYTTTYPIAAANNAAWCATGVWTPESGRAWNQGVNVERLMSAYVTNDGAANSWRTYIVSSTALQFDTIDGTTTTRSRVSSLHALPNGSPGSWTFTNSSGVPGTPSFLLNGQTANGALSGAGTGSVAPTTLAFGMTGAATEQFGGNIRDFRMYANTTLCGEGSIFPALFDDDVNTVAHVVFRHGALVDLKSNAWVMPVNPVPQVTSGAFSIPPSGNLSNPTTYYTLGSGADVLDFPGGVFTIAIVATPANYAAPTSVLLANSNNSTDGWFTSMTVTGNGRFVTRQPAASDLSTANIAALNVPFVLCAGRDGTNSMVKLNFGTIVSAATTYVAPVTRVVFLGNLNGSFPFPGVVHEILATTTAPSDAACIALANTAFARMGITVPP